MTLRDFRPARPLLRHALRALIPTVVTWDGETGIFERVEGPRGFETWREAEEAGRFPRQDRDD